ncbi:MAG: hypothetical protein WDN46_05210 [Methylocella sp.]
MVKIVVWIVAVILIIDLLAADRTTGIMTLNLWTLFAATAYAIFTVAWVWILVVNIWRGLKVLRRGLKALICSSEARSRLFAIIVCSSILFALIWGYQTLAYKIADVSFWGAIAFCMTIGISGIIAAFAVDRSRTGRR